MRLVNLKMQHKSSISFLENRLSHIKKNSWNMTSTFDCRKHLITESSQILLSFQVDIFSGIYVYGFSPSSSGWLVSIGVTDLDVCVPTCSPRKCLEFSACPKAASSVVERSTVQFVRDIFVTCPNGTWPVTQFIYLLCVCLHERRLAPHTTHAAVGSVVTGCRTKSLLHIAERVAEASRHN